MEAFIDGNLLVFSHHDVPGIIAAVATILSDEQVNIAQMAVGRVDAGGEAVGVLNLDSVPSKSAVEMILKNSSIERVRLIELNKPGELPDWLA